MKTFEEFCKDRIGTTAVGITITKEEYEAIQKDALFGAASLSSTTQRRMWNPKAGDKFVRGESVVTVTSVADGVVNIERTYGDGDVFFDMVLLEEWPKISSLTVENGAGFLPAS